MDKNLLRRVDDGAGVAAAEPRFAMLETIREFGRERLADADETVVIGNAYAAFFLALAERAEPELFGPHQVEWLDRLEAELETCAPHWPGRSSSSRARRRCGWLGRSIASGGCEAI